MNKAIIIEDELDAQKLLLKILKEYCPAIEVLGCASDLKTSHKLCKSIQPDLVFLDINLGDFTGFQLLDQLSIRPFKLIVTTAYEEYALKAFRYEAIDYVLKPYTPKSIISAVQRVSKGFENYHLFGKLDAILNQTKHGSKIRLSTSEGIILINQEEIIRVEADRAYSKIYLTTGQKKLVSKPLKEIEEILPSKFFFRVHTSHLLNLNQLEKYSKEEGGYAIMSDQSKIPIARRRKNEFLGLLKF